MYRAFTLKEFFTHLLACDVIVYGCLRLKRIYVNMNLNYGYPHHNCSCLTAKHVGLRVSFIKL